MGFYDSFPQAVEVRCAKGPVIQSVAGHGDLIPDHAAVVGAEGAFKADIVKGQHDFIHIEGAVGGKMGGLLNFRLRTWAKWILPFRERIISGRSLFRLVP